MACIVLGSQLAVPLYVVAGGWSAGFGMQGWLTSLGWLPSSGAGSLQAIFAVAMVHAFASIPWVALIVCLGMLWTHRSTEEQAWLEGGLATVFRRAILPQLRIGLIVAFLWCIVPILTEMVVSNLFLVPTVAEQVYLDASRGSVSRLTYVTAFAICMLPTLSVLAWLLRNSPNWNALTFSTAYFAPNRLDLRRGRWPACLFLWLTLAALVALPTVSLIAKAGWQPLIDDDGKTSYGWSLERFGETVYESFTLFQAEFYWSFLLGLVSSLLAMTMACTLYGLTSPRIRQWAGGLILSLLAVPGPLAGMGIIWLLNRSTPAWLGGLYDRTLAAPVLAQQFRLLPLAWLLIVVTLATISRRTWEQATLDGLNRFQSLRLVVWSQTGRNWLAVWLLLFVASVGELSCSILVLPPGVTTVSMRLFEMLHFGMRHQDSGLCGMLLGLGWLVSWVFWKTLNDR